MMVMMMMMKRYGFRKIQSGIKRTNQSMCIYINDTVNECREHFSAHGVLILWITMNLVIPEQVWLKRKLTRMVRRRSWRHLSGTKWGKPGTCVTTLTSYSHRAPAWRHWHRIHTCSTSSWRHHRQRHRMYVNVSIVKDYFISAVS